jgi:DNA-binding PadR family transcriptional regulator
MTAFPGDLEQMVMLAVLQCEDSAYALDVLRELETRAGRRIARGSLYKTLDRLEAKGLVTWELEEAGPERGGQPRRCFVVTATGLRQLRASRRTLYRMWDGLEGILGRARG